MKAKYWLLYASITVIFWGIWGALIEIPGQAGFPATLSYVVWSFTMIPPALVALWLIGWEMDFRLKPMLLGLTVGFTGAGGQLILFETLEVAPAFLVFPFVEMAPVVTILLAFILLRERTNIFGTLGIVAALIALPLLAYTPTDEQTGIEAGWWTLGAVCVLLAWGFQAYVIKFANKVMKAENIFFYMMLTGVILAPVALLMTDFSEPINYSFEGPGAAALIQILNAIGALFLVYAFRFGKAMIVSPLCNAVAPVITVVISLIIYATIPNMFTLLGIVFAIIAALFMSFDEGDESKADEADQVGHEVTSSN